MSSFISLKSSLDRMLSDHLTDCEVRHPVRGFPPSKIAELKVLVARITYRDWKVIIIERSGFAQMQISTMMKDSLGEDLIENYSRPIFICPRMSDGFIVDAAFELVKEFELHEAAEHFLFSGERVYFPHDDTGKPVQEVNSMQGRDVDVST